MLGHAMAHAESIRCRSSPCDAISWSPAVGGVRSAPGHATGTEAVAHRDERIARGGRTTARNETGSGRQGRSEEHTSELQSHLNLVCRLLLEKKKKKKDRIQTTVT